MQYSDVIVFLFWTSTQVMVNQYPVHNMWIIWCGVYCIESAADETESLATTTVSKPNERELQAAVVEAALSSSFIRKSQISEAQARCLDLQTQQHEAEMELLVIKKNNTIIQHKRKMEVLDAELEYWETMNKSITNTQAQHSRPNTRARKQN